MFRVQLLISIVFVVVVVVVVCLFGFFWLFVFNWFFFNDQEHFMDSSFFHSNISNSNKRRFSKSLVRDSCRIEFSVSNIRCFRIVCLLEALMNLILFT